MSRTGYSDVRAAPHEAWVAELVETLTHRGFNPTVLAPDGDRPDIAFIQPTGERALIDAKCPDRQNYAIKTGAVHAALATPLVTLFIARFDRRVHTVITLMDRLMRGPERATGNGSRTDWYLFRAGGGTEFDVYFPAQVVAATCVTFAECDHDPDRHCPVCWVHLESIYAPCPTHPDARSRV